MINPFTQTLARLQLFYAHHQHKWHLAIIVACGVVMYCNSFDVPFYFDDFPCIVQNPVLRNFSLIFELDRYRDLGMDEDIRNNLVTRMVTYATFALNVRLHGYAVEGYHLVNLAVHLANAMLVYALVRRTIALSYSEPADGHRPGNGLALTVAIIFAIHPAQTNAVTYIVQRFASLATLFCLLSLLAYIKSVFAATPLRRHLYYGGSLLAALFAMFSKEIAFVLPVLVALYDFVFLPGNTRQRWLRLAPLAATMVFLPLTVSRLAALSEITGGSTNQSLDLMNLGQVSRWDYFFTQWRVIVTYLRLLFYPAGLNLDHDYPLYRSPAEPAVFLSGLLLAALLALGVYLLIRCRACDEKWAGWRMVGFGLVWFFVALAMESSIIPLDDLIQEYRLYFPSVGLLLAVATTVDQLRRWLPGQSPGRSKAFVVLTVLTVTALGATTITRNRLWQDEVRFWQDSVVKSPGKARPHINLGAAYFTRRQPDKAMQNALKARNGSAHTFVTRYQLARLFYLLGNNEEAIIEMRQAILLAPNRALFHGALGQLYLNIGDIPAAVKSLRRALELFPGHTEARATLLALGALDADDAAPPLSPGSVSNVN